MSSLDPTISTYDKYANTYDSEVKEFWQKFPKQTLHKFKSALPDKKVLDLGSGSGRDALLLRDAGLNITCLDASSSMVKLTKRLGFPTIQTDFRKLELEDESFGGIWAYTSLIHVPAEEALKVVSRLKASLVKDGIFLFGAIEGVGGRRIERKSMPGATRYFKYYSEGELDELMKSAGYELLFSEKYQPRSSVYLNRIYQVK